MLANEAGAIRGSTFSSTTSSSRLGRRNPALHDDRLRTLDLYPSEAEVCFDIDTYRTLVRQWSATGDRYRASKPTVDFPFTGGRRAQRAYFDAFRDLAAPSFGLRVLRIPAPECHGRLAYERFQSAIAELW